MNNSLLIINDIHIEGFDGRKWLSIVDHVNLKLDRGEVLGLIGESGAGKTTLGLAAMGYVRPGCRIREGKILFDNMDLNRISKHEKRKLRGSRIAYVAQSAAASFNPSSKLIHQFAEVPLKLGLMTNAEAEIKAVEWYSRLNLPEPEKIGYRYPHQVSGGQLQRAMVAMAMAANPDIIIFDEPTTALDVTTQIEMLAAIKKIIKIEKKSAIYISHDLSVVAQLANRIMVLKNGCLVEEGDTKQLLENPEKNYTQKLLSVRSSRNQNKLTINCSSTILEVNNIFAGYVPDKVILKNVSLKVKKQKTVAVIGESGSGKTTLARIITGLLPSSKGNILFDGKLLPRDLASRDKRTLRRLQMIYQMPDVALNPRLKISKIIGRPLSFYFNMRGKELKRKIIELLDMVDLPSKYIYKYSNELSGGEKQRICIARAIAAKPDLIICDEVTSALDPLVGDDILKLLQDIQNELKVSYLFITHDLKTVNAVADEIVVLLKGEIVDKGNKKDILNPPYIEYTKLLLSSIPELDPNWMDNLLETRGGK